MSTPAHTDALQTKTFTFLEALADPAMGLALVINNKDHAIGADSDVYGFSGTEAPFLIFLGPRKNLVILVDRPNL